MGINMNSAAYARDSAGKQKLKEECSRSFNYLKSNLRNCNAYHNLITTISNNWEGVDANKFKESVNSRINSLENSINDYEKKLLAAIDDDYNEFLRFQQANATNMRK